MRLPRRATEAAKAAAIRFNYATGSYAAKAVGDRVVITVDPAKCTVLTDRFISMPPEETS